MYNKLLNFLNSAWFWITLIFLCVAMEAVALYYQYGLEYGPCVLCIHIRIWIAAIIVIGVLGLIFRQHKIVNPLLMLVGALASLGMLERSWKTLGVERGWIVEACSLESGLPSWFAIDKWFPALFEIWEACGYTPELLLGITMAEGLVAASIGLIVAFMAALLSSFIKKH